MTDAIAALGILALVTSGELERWVSAAVVAGLAGSLAIPENWQTRTWMRRLSTIGPVALLLLQIARLFGGANVLELAVEFAAALQIIRLATRRGAAHDQQVIVLALLHLIAGTVIGGGLSYGLCFIGFHRGARSSGPQPFAPRGRGQLPPRGTRPHGAAGRRAAHSAQPARRRPHVPGRHLSPLDSDLLVYGRPLCAVSAGRALVPLAQQAAYGAHGRLRRACRSRRGPHAANRSHHRAARRDPGSANPPPPRLAMHLRGAAFDTYDGRSWSRSLGQRDTATREGGNLWIRRPPDPHRDRVWRMDLEPIDPPVLFAPLNAVAMRVRQRGDPVVSSRLEISSEPEWTFRYGGSDERGVRYEVYVGSEAEGIRDSLSHGDEERYTALPRGVSDRVRTLAHQVVREGATPLEKARSIESYLRTSSPTISVRPRKVARSARRFPFARAAGIASSIPRHGRALARASRRSAQRDRLHRGACNRFGHFYAVRRGEFTGRVFVPERGWQTFDPTPPRKRARSALRVLAFIRDVIKPPVSWDRYVSATPATTGLPVSLISRQPVHVSPALARVKPSALPSSSWPRQGLPYSGGVRAPRLALRCSIVSCERDPDKPCTSCSVRP
jgi:hypothetical protein